MSGTYPTTLKQAIRLTATAVLLAASIQAHAIPMQLTSAQFATGAASAGSVVVETFEGLFGASGNPLTFANGTATSDGSGGFGVTLSTTFCGTAADRCLVGTDIADLRTIDALPAGTTHWGASLHFIRPTDLMEITVTGGSGILSFTTEASALAGFAGFSDALGITSVAFRDLGTPGGGSGNYSFDNVTTAGQARVNVPEPATLSLLGAGLIAFGLARRRRNGAERHTRS